MLANLVSRSDLDPIDELSQEHRIKPQFSINELDEESSEGDNNE